MCIIADARLPGEVLRSLNAYGEVVPFASRHITYDAISGHPDIFFCQVRGKLIVAPNTPAEVYNALKKHHIATAPGSQTVGAQYPESAAYNAFTNARYLLHNTKHTDAAITLHCKELEAIHVNQAYTRCNLVEAAGLYITSDKGIEKTLRSYSPDVFFVDPKSILLPGKAHGFFGGCTGIWNDRLLLTGCCSHFQEGPELKAELALRGMEIIELYDGPLFDGGGILVLP